MELRIIKLKTHSIRGFEKFNTNNREIGYDVVKANKDFLVTEKTPPIYVALSIEDLNKIQIRMPIQCVLEGAIQMLKKKSTFLGRQSNGLMSCPRSCDGNSLRCF